MILLLTVYSSFRFPRSKPSQHINEYLLCVVLRGIKQVRLEPVITMDNTSTSKNTNRNRKLREPNSYNTSCYSSHYAGDVLGGAVAAGKQEEDREFTATTGILLNRSSINSANHKEKENKSSRYRRQEDSSINSKLEDKNTTTTTTTTGEDNKNSCHFLVDHHEERIAKGNYTSGGEQIVITTSRSKAKINQQEESVAIIGRRNEEEQRQEEVQETKATISSTTNCSDEGAGVVNLDAPRPARSKTSDSSSTSTTATTTTSSSRIAAEDTAALPLPTFLDTRRIDEASHVPITTDSNKTSSDDEDHPLICSSSNSYYRQRSSHHQQQQQQDADPPDLVGMLSLSDCYDYVARVKRGLHELNGGGQQLFDDFLELLGTWVMRGLSWRDVFSKMCLILKDVPDLLDEFPNFLPSGAREEAELRLATASRRNEDGNNPL